MRQGRTWWEKRPKKKSRRDEMNKRNEHQRRGRWRGAGTGAWVNFQNNTEGKQSERLPVHATAASCRGDHGHRPLCCPPRGNGRTRRCGRRTSLYLNPKADIWEDPAQDPAQPQPLCDLSGAPYRSNVPLDPRKKAHNHTGTLG